MVLAPRPRRERDPVPASFPCIFTQSRAGGRAGSLGGGGSRGSLSVPWIQTPALLSVCGQVCETLRPQSTCLWKGSWERLWWVLQGPHVKPGGECDCRLCSRWLEPVVWLMLHVTGLCAGEHSGPSFHYDGRFHRT